MKDRLAICNEEFGDGYVPCASSDKKKGDSIGNSIAGIVPESVVDGPGIRFVVLSAAPMAAQVVIILILMTSWRELRRIFLNSSN